MKFARWNVFDRWRSRRERAARVDEIHGEIVAAARAPELYAAFFAPDDLDGRFEMVVLHAGLVLRRLGEFGEAGRPMAQDAGAKRAAGNSNVPAMRESRLTPMLAELLVCCSPRTTGEQSPGATNPPHVPVDVTLTYGAVSVHQKPTRFSWVCGSDRDKWGVTVLVHLPGWLA